MFGFIGDIFEFLFGLVFLAAWLVGTVRLFMGRNYGWGVASVFIPFVCIAGFFMQPKPASALYLRQSAAQRAESDLRWPSDAVRWQRILELVKTDQQRRDEARARAWLKAGREEVDRDVPPLD